MNNFQHLFPNLVAYFQQMFLLNSINNGCYRSDRLIRFLGGGGGEGGGERGVERGVVGVGEKW